MRDSDENARPARVRRIANSAVRPALLVLGWAMVALGAVGIVVPGLPTVPFLLVALWAFARSSQRFHDWLYNHPRFGPPLRDWRDHRAIPVRAKLLAILMMTGSVAIIAAVADGWQAPAIVGICLLFPAVFIVTRSSGPK